jgi:hypothetical protein
MVRGNDPRKKIQTLKREVKILRNAVRRVPRRGRNGESRAATALRRVWGAAQDAGGRAQDGIFATYETVRDRGVRAAEAGRRHVHRRPLTLMLAAILAGILIGQFARRRSYY